MALAKSLGWLGVICLVGWGVDVVCINIMAWHGARDVMRKYPLTALSPQPLVDTRIADLGEGTAIKPYGYTVRVPWKKVVKENKLKSMTIVDFGDGASMLILDPANGAGLFAVARGVTPEEMATGEKLYGSRTLSSNYEFVSAQMYETGAEIGPMQPRMINLRAMLLMSTKPAVKASVIYPLTAAHLRGFQIGDPRVVGEAVRLLLFDKKDRELQLWIRQPKSGSVLTQEQVNGIVASVQAPA